MSNVNEKVAEAWSNSVGRKIAFELRVVEAADGRKQTQLINPESGSLVVAVNATGDDAVQKLVENAGVTFLDDPITWAEVEGPNQGNQVNKADLSVPTPDSRPGAAVEAQKSASADSLAEDVGSEKPAKKSPATSSTPAKSGDVTEVSTDMKLKELVEVAKNEKVEGDFSRPGTSKQQVVDAILENREG